MLYALLYPLHESISFLNVFKYITFRTFGALITALVLYFLIGRWVIRFFHRSNLTQVIRDDGPQSHLQKKGTPTMGGLAILFATLISSLLWIDLGNNHFWVTIVVLLTYGLIGFYDDYCKIRYGSSRGLRARSKFLLQVLCAFLIGILLMSFLKIDTTLAFPFFKNFRLDLGLLYPLFAVLVIVGTSNAVNLTDGLDGLATVPLIFSFATYGILAYIAGHIKIAAYL
ncbi:MAG: phospho-N-acetylmuramoyl-pentapeptide-transferase, partial [Deltaproteobacteria bacterium]|nr:phospho-N-acetylmuramoyl-pentapeptide-transferase [Deltaproteobacteria bacterium]